MKYIAANRKGSSWYRKKLRMKKKMFIIFPFYSTSLGTPPTLEQDTTVLEKENKLQEDQVSFKKGGFKKQHGYQ